jgi:geranylgeranyl pyrophosphate synthase
MLSESIEQKPAWLFTLPVISCLVVGGKSTDAIPVAATWVALDHASHLLDAVGDGDFQADGFFSTPGQALNFSTSLIFAAYHFLYYIRDPESLRRVMDVFSDAGFKATLGQHISFSQLETLPLEKALEQYWRMVILKSGSIFRMGTAGGAAAGTADKELIDALGDYGTAIGVIMQMMDDCRDMLDIITGKYEVSLPVLLYSMAKGSDKVVYPDARSKDTMVKTLQEAHVAEMLAALLQEWQKNALDSLGPLKTSSMLDALKTVLYDVSKLPFIDDRNI